MGAMMGVAGAPFPFFVTFVDPVSTFDLFIAVNAIAMPMIGGTAHWLGPVIGALLVGTTQEIVKVTISSEINVLVVGHHAGAVHRRCAAGHRRSRAEALA